MCLLCQAKPLLVVAAPRGKHAAIILKLRRDGTASVVGIFEVPGQQASSTYLHGSFLYSVEIGGKTVNVGAMQDPFVARPVCGSKPAKTRRPFAVRRVPEAVVTLTVGAEMLDLDTRNRTKVRFFRLKGGDGLPKQLTPKSFDTFRKKSTLMSTVEAHALANANTIKRK